MNILFVNVMYEYLSLYFILMSYYPDYRDVQIGDVVTVGECRPLSKTVKFNTLKVTKASGNKKSFKKF